MESGYYEDYEEKWHHYTAEDYDVKPPCGPRTPDRGMSLNDIIEDHVKEHLPLWTPLWTRDMNTRLGDLAVNDFGDVAYLGVNREKFVIYNRESGRVREVSLKEERVMFGTIEPRDRDWVLKGFVPGSSRGVEGTQHFALVVDSEGRTGDTFQISSSGEIVWEADWATSPCGGFAALKRWGKVALLQKRPPGSAAPLGPSAAAH